VVITGFLTLKRLCGDGVCTISLFARFGWLDQPSGVGCWTVDIEAKDDS